MAATTRTTVTDLGVCTSVNGKTIEATYETGDNSRIDAFKEVFDAGASDVPSPVMVRGSGSAQELEFWLNVRNPSGGSDEQGSRGRAAVALNDWFDAFSVR